MKKIYTKPEVCFEDIDIDELMLNTSHTGTLSYNEDPSSETQDEIDIFDTPIDTPDVPGGGWGSDD
ncbi:MAG: hypothetical protein KBT34_06985 [Prevotella sp.]|nr:hypothetical protein [Candidatus Prevotella equi]